MKQLIRIVFASALFCPVIGMLGSCSEEADCSMVGRPMMNCLVYTLNEMDIAVRDTLDSLTVTAFGTDSILVNAQQDVRDVALPLRYTADSTILVFRYNQQTTDTVTVRHTNTPYFLSMDCGYQVTQSLTSVAYTRHHLDSIYIFDNEVGLYGSTNLQLFY